MVNCLRSEGWMARVKFAAHAVVLGALTWKHQGKARFGLNWPFRAHEALRVFQSLDKGGCVSCDERCAIFEGTAAYLQGPGGIGTPKPWPATGNPAVISKSKPAASAVG